MDLKRQLCRLRVIAVIAVNASSWAHAVDVAPEVSLQQQTPVSASLDYRSAFVNYQPYTDQPLQGWREANDTVRAIGGWRSYAKEALQPEPSVAPAAAGAKQ